jgi:hypothetical protein
LPADRSVRYLTSLKGASTSRVLNLTAVAAASGETEEYVKAPLFASPVINSAIILKHRIRADESYLFSQPKSVATKIIVPFDCKDLKAGGRSFFVDQIGYLETLRDVGHYRDTIDRDLRVLDILNGLPSLDPFLLREHLRANSITCADCYIGIAPADQERMYTYVAGEISKLISLATGGSVGTASTSKLVSALLSNEVDEKLEPLKLTLSMNAEEFREGVFSWRGFLYYKWSMEQLWPEIMGVLKAIRSTLPRNAISRDQGKFFDLAQREIITKVRIATRSVENMLAIYDQAYDDLVRNQNPKGFRDFLLSAPHYFLTLGENMGAISHVLSFWRFRFPQKFWVGIEADELVLIFQDFASTFSDNRVAEEAAA